MTDVTRTRARPDAHEVSERLRKLETSLDRIEAVVMGLLTDDERASLVERSE